MPESNIFATIFRLFQQNFSGGEFFMIGKYIFVIILLSFTFAVTGGRMVSLSSAVLSGAAGAVELVISLTGMMCLWCGILEVLRDAGAIKKLSKLLSPFMRFAFPSVHGKKTEETVCAAIAANILGIGNAATPLAVRAMNELDLMNPEPARASQDMICFAVLGTAPFSLMPTTVVTLLASFGHASPFSVIPPVWISSAVTFLFALLLCRALSSAGRVKRHG